MRLSDAIRRGCEIRPLKIVGRFYDEGNGACALGAAMFGADTLDFCRLSHKHPALFRRVWSYGEDAPLWQVIADLNDNYDVTREGIADWIAWLEGGGTL